MLDLDALDQMVSAWFMHLKKSSKSRQIVTMDLLDLMGFGFPTEV